MVFPVLVLSALMKQTHSGEQTGPAVCCLLTAVCWLLTDPGFISPPAKNYQLKPQTDFHLLFSIPCSFYWSLAAAGYIPRAWTTPEAKLTTGGHGCDCRWVHWPTSYAASSTSCLLWGWHPNYFTTANIIEWKIWKRTFLPLGTLWDVVTVVTLG